MECKSRNIRIIVKPCQDGEPYYDCLCLQWSEELLADSDSGDAKVGDDSDGMSVDSSDDSIVKMF
jgi:hypothetical protein